MEDRLPRIHVHSARTGNKIVLQNIHQALFWQSKHILHKSIVYFRYEKIDEYI